MENMLPRYLNLSTTFSSTSSMKIAGCGATELGACWKSTSVFLSYQHGKGGWFEWPLGGNHDERGHPTGPLC